MNSSPAPSSEDRALAAASYLLDLTPLGLLGAVVVLLVRGRESRFVGVHGAQAILVSIALRLVAQLLPPAAALSPLPLAGPSTMITSALASLLPVIVMAWLGFAAFHGRPAALPLLGRWSERLVDRSAG